MTNSNPTHRARLTCPGCSREGSPSITLDALIGVRDDVMLKVADDGRVEIRRAPPGFPEPTPPEPFLLDDLNPAELAVCPRCSWEGRLREFAASMWSASPLVEPDEPAPSGPPSPDYEGPPHLHLHDGDVTECGQPAHEAGGLRDTPHPDNVGTFYAYPICRGCFGSRARRGDQWAKVNLERDTVAGGAAR